MTDTAKPILAIVGTGAALGGGLGSATLVGMGWLRGDMADLRDDMADVRERLARVETKVDALGTLTVVAPPGKPDG